MEHLWSKVLRFLRVLGSYVVALLRLVMWTILMFFSGFQRTVFTRSEVAGVELKLTPLRCDMEDTDEKLAYIDKLCLENPDLVIEDDFEDNFPFDEGN